MHMGSETLAEMKKSPNFPEWNRTWYTQQTRLMLFSLSYQNRRYDQPVCSTMGAVRIHHSIREIATQPVILWILLGGKLKWLPLNFGFNDVMRTAPI